MTLEQYASLAEIVGALAVVITLIYLAVQVRQNTASIRAAAHQSWLSVTIAEQSAAQNPANAEYIATGLFDPAALTGSAWIPFSTYCHTFVLKAESTYFLRKQGLVEPAVCDKEFDRAANFLKVAGPAQWWQAGARTQFTAEFVAMIEQRMGQATDFGVYDFTPGKGFHPYVQPSTPTPDRGSA